MRKAGRRILAIIISIFISIVFAGCTSGQTDATGSPSPSPAPMPSENSLAGFPPEEYVSRDGFNMTCGILITDGVKAYYRCDGGASEEWEIREADLATGKVRTLAASSAFQDESGAANLFLDGGRLYFTVVNSNGDMKTLYRYDEGTGNTKILEAQSILLTDGKIYFVLENKLYSRDVSGAGGKLLMESPPKDMAVSKNHIALLEDWKTITLIKKDGSTQKLDCSLPEHRSRPGLIYFWDRNYADDYGQLRIYGDVLFYFAAYLDESGEGKVEQLLALDTDKKEPMPIFTLESNFESIDFNIYEGKVYYSCSEIPNELGQKVTYHLYEYDLQTQENREIYEQEQDFLGEGFTKAYWPVALYGGYALCWFMDKSQDTGSGVIETYSLKKIGLADGSVQPVDQFEYQIVWNDNE